MAPSSLLKRCLQLLGVSMIAATAMASGSAQAAERIYLSYGLLERSISFEELEKYANTGELSDDLYVYTSYVNTEQRQQLRSVLKAKAELSPIAISQFLYSPQGEILLGRLGQVIQPEARTDGAKAIRAALILAAVDRQKGLSPLNVVRNFPTRGIRVDLLRTLQIADELEKLVTWTNLYTQAIEAQASQGVGDLPLPTPLMDLTQRGRNGWDVLSFNLRDDGRVSSTGFVKRRSFPMNLYLPRSVERSGSPIPFVVISHGLGSDLNTFKYLAEHLASHGFAVAVPEHPGSNARQMKALLKGLTDEVTEASEFHDRPLDITFLLDELTRKAQGDTRLRRINLQRVGVLGQSFGGYTALALAGAPLNGKSLAETQCTQTKQVNTFNISLVLQCLAAELPNPTYYLGDARVAAVVAINPIGSVALGQDSIGQIKVPTMIVTGNADTVAPSILEQVLPFTWLHTPERYLVMVDRGTHFSFLADSDSRNNSLPIPPELIGPNPLLARRYLNGLSLAFFGTYIMKQPAFRPYLTANYTQAISQNPLRLSLITQFDPAQVRR
ncbi:alpha/beta hydrolase [Alkalinema sp. FACHB-956]|uniref:alpha/beta hydrolase n=1 Tax=Alkalinema sp. FACHB-956 TaxID=2692768 RepID=UPI001F54DC88|nr:alpha/beta hydrolase [Alkalinema sp. FACHB-956]